MVEKDCRGLVVVGGEVTFGGEMTQTGFGGGGVVGTNGCEIWKSLICLHVAFTCLCIPAVMLPP